MKYLNSTFTVQSPEKTEGLTCPRCVFGEKWGEHAPECVKADWIAVYLPTRVNGEPDPTRSGFKSEEAAWEYVYARMCRQCRQERARVLSGNGEEFDSDWPACAAEWMVLSTNAYERAESFDAATLNPPTPRGDISSGGEIDSDPTPGSRADAADRSH